MINFSNPVTEYLFLKKKIDNKIATVLKSNSYILGKEVNKFEKNFSKFTQVKYSVGTSSGTDALILALKSLNIGKGDEVITTSHTAVATVAAIVEVGAVPVFVDINNDFLMDVPKVSKIISKKTKAIIAVHIYGMPVELNLLLKICKINNLKLIEDCSQAHGAEYNKKKVGSFGIVSCFSFYPTKNLSTFGDGGIVCTNSKRIYKKIKFLREYGWDKKKRSRLHGINNRLDELHASILNIKIKYLKLFNKKRLQAAKMYISRIKNKDIVLPKIHDHKTSVFHLFVIRIQKKKRNRLIKHLLKNKIKTGIHYPFPIHQLKPFKAFCKGDLPITEKISDEIISLPMYPLISSLTVQHVVKAINNFK